MREQYETAAAVTKRLEERVAERTTVDRPVDRRAVLGGLGLAGGACVAGLASAPAASDDDHAGHGNFGAVDEYRDRAFDPHEFLRAFNTGRSGRQHVEQEVYEEDGRTVRHFQIVAVDVDVEIAPGVEFPAWTFNGQIPGPTLRAVEGDLIRVDFVNGSEHAHTIHPHLRNLNPEMDGTPQNGPGVLDPGETFTYEWLAQPAGIHLYHCHSMPLKAHMHRGLYGVIVVDPDPERVREQPREYVNYHGRIDDAFVEDLVGIARSRNHEHPENDAVNEMVMVMNGFDTNFDGENEVYAANTRAFAYGLGSTDGEGEWDAGETKRPIRVRREEPQRVYLVNTTEFDPINSFHTHSQFFDYYDHGTTLLPTRKTVDTVMQTQAQRGIVELDYGDHEPGLYMFHAHQSEFAELGWMSFFEVVDG
jgi:FtsP/CotA-like multicopper oxidase with cupredoxin domain